MEQIISVTHQLLHRYFSKRKGTFQSWIYFTLGYIQFVFILEFTLLIRKGYKINE